MIESKHIGEWGIGNYISHGYTGVIVDLEGHV